ncbi:hypothetical protein SAMN04487895_107259 [Paenibacillus sophorae]|uniref:Uncharacterized protein n=1 Tax=Paenibacillus sophorae TaxID=1333845 RepID=A0A1H8PM93_9BACL|nr:hypothetical protein [Paenibacillus sophorae]QWU16624.1 hypothetical protein KP014_05200 [Paenibacillus sophorae]SEO42886.1 hypothetical protein SAMN04487895_107259 [Paenibacillus sophorae]
MKPIRTENFPSVRLTAGMYALSKLSAAGLTSTLLGLLALAGPHTAAGWLASPAYNVYAYALTVSLLADGLLRLTGTGSRAFLLIIYALAGFGAGLWLAHDQGSGWAAGAFAGIAVLLLFRLTQLAGERIPALLPVFALFVPLLCLLL